MSADVISSDVDQTNGMLIPLTKLKCSNRWLQFLKILGTTSWGIKDLRTAPAAFSYYLQLCPSKPAMTTGKMLRICHEVSNKIRKSTVRNKVAIKMRNNKSRSKILKKMRNTNCKKARKISTSSSVLVPSDPHILSEDSAISYAEAFIPLDNGVCYWNRLPKEISDEIFRYAYGRRAGTMVFVIKAEIDEWNKYEELERWEKWETFEVSRTEFSNHLLQSLFQSAQSDQQEWQT